MVIGTYYIFYNRLMLFPACNYLHSIVAKTMAIMVLSIVVFEIVLLLAALPPVLSGSPWLISSGSGSAMSGMSLLLHESSSQKQIWKIDKLWSLGIYNLSEYLHYCKRYQVKTKIVLDRDLTWPWFFGHFRSCTPPASAACPASSPSRRRTSGHVSLKL